MSWIRTRPLTALAAFAFALRVACATATEFHPLFPAYYYTDASLAHENAVGALEDIRAGRAPRFNGSLAERLQTSVSLGVYRTFGVRPFLLKLLNALLGALAVAAFAWTLSGAFPALPAALAGLALAAWPSHVFFTSQNLKEAPIALLVYAALGAAFAAGFDAGAPRARTIALALSSGAALLCAGFLRTYLPIALGTALLLALGLSARRPPRTNAALTAAVLMLALAFFPYGARTILAAFHTQELGAADQDRIAPRLIPVTIDTTDAYVTHSPTSPEGISRFRDVRQAADRQWAATEAGRTIGTQIYPGEVFKTWLDVALYVPKGALTVLFMPLPGLYPLEGKPGRWAAAAENVTLLVLACLALAGAVRGRRSPQRLALAAFFATMTVGAALLEFDLGSAGRHKLLYCPMMFPFAAEEALRLLGLEPA
ncbi:MAG: hypothetical protein HYV14_06315 [Elusimicrobia bacterium]|nr:hypothetical protein [Elusimicrobiota bacterium]